MYNKKGMSPVVATLALLMITVAAAAIIAGIVVPLVKNRLSESTECLGYENYFSFYKEFDYNCYRVVEDGEESYVLIAFSVEADSVSDELLENVGGMRLAFLGGGDSVGVDVMKNSDASSELGGVRMLKVNEPKIIIPEKGGVRTYIYTSPIIYDSVEVYPVLESGRQCEKTDSMRIEGFICENELNLAVEE